MGQPSVIVPHAEDTTLGRAVLPVCRQLAFRILPDTAILAGRGRHGIGPGVPERNLSVWHNIEDETLQDEQIGNGAHEKRACQYSLLSRWDCHAAIRRLWHLHRQRHDAEIPSRLMGRRWRVRHRIGVSEQRLHHRRGDVIEIEPTLGHANTKSIGGTLILTKKPGAVICSAAFEKYARRGAI
jgi:hypothetical protein